MLGIVGSFNPAFYRKIVSQPLTRSFGFLAVFLFIISAIISFELTVFLKSLLPEATSWVQANFEDIIADLPDIEIKDGEVIEPAEPYIREWSFKEGDRSAVVIDAVIGDYYGIVESYDNLLLLSRKTLVVKSAKSDFAYDIKTYRLDSINSFKISRIASGLAISFEDTTFNLTPESIKRVLERISLYVYPISLVWFGLTYIFVKILQILLFSIFSLICNSQLNAKLSYSQLFNIGTYALVPSTVIAIAQELSGVHIPLYGLFYCIIYCVYLYLGIKSSRQEPVTVTGM